MDRIVAFSGATNFRDLGGYETTTGAVVLSGRVLRSDSLHTLAAADLMCFDGLDIRVIYDLRGLGERNDQELPAVFHCFGGKDRTGFAAAVLLSALGVERDVVLDDYELTDQLRGAARIPEVVQAFVAAGIGEPAAVAMMSTCRWGMVETLTRIDMDFGGVDHYLQERCGLSLETLERPRGALLD